MDLFSDPPTPRSSRAPSAPLADRVRPSKLEEVIGQEALLGTGKPLRRILDGRDLHSLILWGPPGSGKTTLARLMGQSAGTHFQPFSAVRSGIKEVREMMAQARRYYDQTARKTLVFIDEIHRFNRAQQDAFLPFVEAGDIVLIGATTENPSFEVNAPLLSRLKVYLLEPLGEDALVSILRRAVREARGLDGGVELGEAEARLIARQSSGDARRALNTLELVSRLMTADGDGRKIISEETIRAAVAQEPLVYDKAGEEHFNIISALHKSLRNSDPHAAVYWLARMLEAGENPLYVARRLVRFASEDVGNADPEALSITIAAQQAFHFLGMPEGALALAQATVYLATAPKSNAVYRAYGEAVDKIREGHTPPVPLHLRNAPTPLMKESGYGKGYQYAHDFESGVTEMECLPEKLRGTRFYQPGTSGFEKVLAERMREWEEKRKARKLS